MRRILLSIALFALLLGALYGYQKFHAATPQLAATPSVVLTPVPAPAKDEPWPVWNAAVNSAAEDGTGFFDPRRADRFVDAFPENQRRYVIQLVSRAFLPEPGCAAFTGKPDSEKALAYLQFNEIPDAKERQTLAAAGIDLDRFVAGNSWRVQTSVGMLRKLVADPNVRSVTPVDPRDKLNPAFWHETAPDYAGGEIPFSIITRKNLAAEQAKAIAAEIPTSTLHIEAPSVLGDRATLRVPATVAAATPTSYRDTAIAIARSVDVLFVEPPATTVRSRDTAKPRDITTDDSSNITDVRDSGPLLTGGGVVVAVREIGRPDAHIDFSARLQYVESDGATDTGNRDHSTAVVGQIGSLGFNNPAAKGVAPGCSMLAYSVGSVAPFGTADVTDSTSKSARISNHSYGPSGSSLRFGTYESVSADWDTALRVSDQLGIFAGYEDGMITPAFFKQDYFVGAKNTVLVGATNANAHAGDDNPPHDKADGLASFTFFGPMNDGRIKPDLVAFGSGVTLDNGTNGDTVNSGTSFATPAVSGIAALVLQQYRKVTNTEPSAAMLKALLCNTASDLGNPGPDAQYGFGIANAEAAVNIVSLGVAPEIAPFRESSIGGLSTNGNLYTVALQIDAPTLLRATLCWFDPAGDPAAAKALVNDLDLALVSPTGVTYFPFSLDKNNPQSPATAIGPNTVDPIEQLVVNTNETGTWFLRVTGTIPSGSQNFALVFNRPPVALPVTASILASPKSGVAPLLVSFQAGALNFGSNATYAWDFGDGALGSGFDVTHTYQTPGDYIVNLTVTVGTVVKTDSITISVLRRTVDTFAKKLTLAMNYKVPGLADDSLQFSMVIPELVMTAQQTREAIRDGTYEGTSYKLFLNNTQFTTVLLNRHAVYKEKIKQTTAVKGRIVQFSINLRRGEVDVKISKTDLETVLNLNANSTIDDFKKLDVRLENDDTVYTSSLPVLYTPGKLRGKGKYPFKQ